MITLKLNYILFFLFHEPTTVHHPWCRSRRPTRGFFSDGGPFGHGAEPTPPPSKKRKQPPHTNNHSNTHKRAEATRSPRAALVASWVSSTSKINISISYHVMSDHIYTCVCICIYMTGAKYSATGRSFGSLAASLAGTLRASCGTRAKHRYERKRNLQYGGLLTPVTCTSTCLTSTPIRK